LLLHYSIVDAGNNQHWDLLAGALLCSLGVFGAFFVFRPTTHE
jgi:hypothetical protein